VCIPDDPICAPDGTDNRANTLWATTAWRAEAAAKPDFAVNRFATN
jgi:hypothetical protein